MAELSVMGLKSKLAALAKAPSAKPVRIGAGGGLHLLVKPGQEAGTGAWVLRLTIAGKRRDMGLGAYPITGLADARLAAQDAKRMATKGEDPIAIRATARKPSAPVAAPTSFRTAAEDLHKAKAAEWKNPKHGDQWLGTLEAHVFPVFGSKPVAEGDTDDVLRALQPIWTKIPETASRVRGRIEAVFDYAAAKGLRPRGFNPAAWRGHLSEVLGAPTKLKAVVRREKDAGENRPSLPWQQMPAFMAGLRKRSGMAALALQFAILTAARSGETRGMLWREVNDETKVWAIPGSRMKGNKLHQVPLSSVASAVLEKMKGLADGRDSLVFPGQRQGRPLSDMTISMLIRGMSFDGLKEGDLPRWRDAEGRAVVPHGFRATFKAWALAHGYADHLSEKALAHSDKDKVRAAYARDALVEERRPMMEAWARWCMGQSGEVTDLAAERAKRTA